VPFADDRARHRNVGGHHTADAMNARPCWAGGRIGSIEESFIARTETGDCLYLRRPRAATGAGAGHDGVCEKSHAQNRRVPQWKTAAACLFSDLAERVPCV